MWHSRHTFINVKFGQRVFNVDPSVAIAWPFLVHRVDQIGQVTSKCRGKSGRWTTLQADRVNLVNNQALYVCMCACRGDIVCVRTYVCVCVGGGLLCVSMCVWRSDYVCGFYSSSGDSFQQHMCVCVCMCVRV